MQALIVSLSTDCGEQVAWKRVTVMADAIIILIQTAKIMNLTM